MGWENAPSSSPAPLRRPLPLASPDLSSLPPMPPRTYAAWRGFRGGVPAWELSRLPGSECAGQSPSAPLPLLLESPSHVPLLISPASGSLILSGLHFSFPLSPLMSYQFTWAFLLSPWASGSSTSGQQAPLLWGEANSASSHTTILTLPWSSILNIAVCTCQSQTPNLSLPQPFPPGNQKFIL